MNVERHSSEDLQVSLRNCRRYSQGLSVGRCVKDSDNLAVCLILLYHSWLSYVPECRNISECLSVARMFGQREKQLRTRIEKKRTNNNNNNNNNNILLHGAESFLRS